MPTTTYLKSYGVQTDYYIAAQQSDSKKKKKNLVQIRKIAKTYNTGDSPVVTDLSTDPAITSLSRAERTGCRVL